jgi:hypothetical protein
MVPPICTRPSDTTGYDSVIENELNTATGFNVTVGGCAADYEGTASVAACTASGNYSLSGCSPIVCTRPSDTTGYDSVIDNELNTATGFNVTVECAANYEGTASVAACTASGDYSLSGCLRVPDKTSGGLAVSVVIGMIINAMIMTM